VKIFFLFQLLKMFDERKDIHFTLTSTRKTYDQVKTEANLKEKELQKIRVN
jgi:hypothetical protein